MNDTVAVQTLDSSFHTFELPKAFAVRPRAFMKREDMPKALLAGESTTYGWDSVNCVKVSVVNAALAKSDAYPKRLMMPLNRGENWAIDASFKPWLVAQGGSGAILMMRLPLASAKMTYGTDALEFTDGSALISLKLRYVPQNPRRTVATPPVDNIEQLIADAKARAVDDPAVVVQRVDYGKAKPDERQKALFEASLALLLNSNLVAFTHIFTVVNLNQKAAAETFFWLKPTYTSYAYFQGVTDDSSYFAVLNQTENRSPEGLTNQVSASAIPAGMNSAILLSSQLFMRQFVFPGMTRAFTHADAETFDIVALGQAIASKKRVKLDFIRVGPIDYTPYMDSFRLQIVGDEIQIQSKVSINISPGIDAFIDATHFYVLGLVEKEDGTMTLDFEPSGEPIVNSWYTVAFWVTMTQMVATVIGAVIGAAVGEAIKNVLVKVIVISLIAAVAGVAAAIPQIVAEVISKGARKAMPSIGPLIDEASAPVDWPKSSGFTLKSAELNDSFQMGGMLAMPSA